MEKRFNKKVLIFILLAAVAAGLFGAAMHAEKEPPGPDSRYAVFLADTPAFVDISGERSDTSPPYIDGGTFYVPVLTALSGIGINTDGDAVMISGIEYDIQDIKGSEDEVYLAADELCDRFGLEYRQYGHIAEIGFTTEDIDSDERSSLSAEAGYTGYTDRAPKEEEPVHIDPIDPYEKASYENVTAWIKALEEEYPELITAFIAGQSVEGRDIWGMALGKGSRVVYMEGAIHPSEYVTSNVVIYIVERYAAGYYDGSCEEGYISFKDLLDNFTFYLIPQVNPDGVNIVQNGFYASTKEVWRYDDQGAIYPYQYKANANGVDINRNFPYHWDPMLENGITWPCRRYYCGPEAASEPETRMIINTMDNIPAEVFIDFHKFGETVNWIDTEADDAYRERYTALGERIASDSGFEDTGTEYIEFGGYATNYNIHVNDVFGCTVEVCAFYNYNQGQLDRVVKEIWRIGLVIGEELLKLDDNKEGLRVEVNGRTVVTMDGAAKSDSYISFEQFRDICEALGGTLSMSDGEVSVTLKGRTISREMSDEIRPGADVYASDGSGNTVNITHLLSLFGAFAEKGADNCVRVYP